MKSRHERHPPPHPQLCSDGLPVSLSVSPADLIQLLHLLLTPPGLTDGWVEEVLPETTNVLRIPRSFKLRRRKRRGEKRRREERGERGGRGGERREGRGGRGGGEERGKRGEEEEEEERRGEDEKERREGRRRWRGGRGGEERGEEILSLSVWCFFGHRVIG